MELKNKLSKRADIKIATKFGLSITFLFVIFILTGIYNPFSAIENKWHDFKFSGAGIISSYFKISGEADYDSLYSKYIHKKADEKITIVAIDEETTKTYGWPFKRRHYAKLFEKLQKLDVKVIGVDILFFDPDRDNPENDRVLISSLKKYDNIVNLLTIEKQHESIDLPIKGIVENSRLMAQPHSDLVMSGDGHIRYMRLFYEMLFYSEKEQDFKEFKFLLSNLAKYNKRYKNDEYKDVPIPLLATAVYSLYKDVPLKKIYERWQNDNLILNYRLPKLWVKKYKYGAQKTTYSTYRYISIKDIMEDNLSEEEKSALKDGVALIGATATAAYDHFPSPYMTLTPGIEFHATVIDNLLHDDYLRPVSFLLKLIILIIAIWLPIFSINRSTIKITIMSLVLSLFMAFLSVYSIKYCYDIEFAIYFIALFLSYAYVMAYKSIVEGKEKRWIKNTFSQYLSPKVVNILTNDPSKLTLGGEKRDMTVFFLDVAGFTSMSEKMTPEELTKLLNKYLSELTDIILKYDGVVDKYIGDCIMAFWNAPLDQQEHRTLACYAAIDCIEKIKELNIGSENKTSVRIGLNSGNMIVGNMGSTMRFSYTVLGDNVNLASRLEGANKFFHSKIMISEDVHNEAKNKIAARFLGKIRVVGKAIPVNVYEPLYRIDDKDNPLKIIFDKYQKGIEHFYKKEYEKAISRFSEILASNPEDGPSSFYKELSENYVKNGDKDFDGVFNLTSK